MCVCEHMFVCHVNAGAWKGFGSPGTGAAGGCEPLDVSDGRPVPQEQQVFLMLSSFSNPFRDFKQGKFLLQ